MINEIESLREEQLEWSRKLGTIVRENPERPLTDYEEYYILMMIGKRILQLETARDVMEKNYNTLAELAKS